MARLIIIAVVGLIVYWIFRGIGSLIGTLSDKINGPERKRLEGLKQKEQEEQRKQISEIRRKERKVQEKAQEEKDKAFIEKYKNLTPEQILLDETLSHFEKNSLLTKLHGYTWSDAEELNKTAGRAKKKAKLNAVKRKITQKAQELYGDIPSDDNRKPIPDDVKMFVWQRDAGKCVKCGNNQSLEFDHIIPIAKGGSNTERNIQLLCEQCNRDKSDNIT